jgi:broad specificity phosphatase PhoE
VAAIVHLIRHGTVHNPQHVVYADLPGFHLSPAGRAEAEAAAAFLSSHPLRRVVTSPLERARETADIVAAPHGLVPVADRRLREWELGRRWAGIPWDLLPRSRPGELEAYLATPDELPFAPESLEALAERVAAAIADHCGADGPVAFVSHQDPIQAARLALTGRPLSGLHVAKPDHAAVVSLEPGDPWRELEHWAPAGDAAR